LDAHLLLHRLLRSGSLLRLGGVAERLLLPPLTLLLLPTLALLQAHGLHHADILRTRDRAPADGLQLDTAHVLAADVALLDQLLPRDEAPHRVLQHHGPAAQELRAHALHVVHHLALEQHHRLSETELGGFHLELLEHARHSLLNVAALHPRAQAVEGTIKVLVAVARGVALATHAHRLDHAAATAHVPARQRPPRNLSVSC